MSSSEHQEGILDGASASNAEQETIQSSDENVKTGDLADKIRRHKYALCSTLEIDECNLLDLLVDSGALTADQVEVIQAPQQLRRNRIEQLLDYIVDGTAPDEKVQKFFTLLEQTNQKHASNFLLGDGIRTEEYADDWPFFKCECEFRTFEKNKSKLMDLIDPENGLLDELMSADCISHRHKQKLETLPEDYKKAQYLVNIILLRGSLAKFKEFIRCLKKTEQNHIVPLMTPDVVCGGRPLNDEQARRLKDNQSTLINHICIDSSGLLAHLRAVGCITQRQKESIESGPTESKRIGKLLDIIRRGSEANFEKFVECLRDTGQHLVSRILKEDCAVACVDAANVKTDGVDKQELHVVDQLKEILRIMPDEDKIRLLGELFKIEEVSQYVNHVTRLSREGVDLAAVVKQNSIGFYFICRTLSGLQHLHDLYHSDQLKNILQRIFTALSKDRDPSGNGGLRIETLRWDTSNYVDCARLVSAKMDLPTLSDVYRFAQQVPSALATYDVVNLPIDQSLPIELIEILLIRFAVRMFTVLNRITSSADRCALISLLAVRRLWWDILANRKYVRRLLKRYFRRACSPFRCTPQKLKRLSVAGDGDVMGVAENDDELYVTREKSNVIEVFSMTSSASRIVDDDKIIVPGLKNPIDITVCAETRNCYVTDYDEYAIWRVSLKHSKQTEKLITMEWKPLSMSVKHRRLLVTPDDGRALFLFTDNGSQLNRIDLPGFMSARHALISTDATRNTFIVGHHNRFVRDTDPEHQDSVSEVDVSGNVIHSFTYRQEEVGSIRFQHPYYLVCDVNNHVIVTDRGGKRIILLEPDLRLKRVLMDSLDGQPRRICLSRARILVVGYLRSTQIDIFAI